MLEFSSREPGKHKAHDEAKLLAHLNILKSYARLFRICVNNGAFSLAHNSGGVKVIAVCWHFVKEAF